MRRRTTALPFVLLGSLALQVPALAQEDTGKRHGLSDRHVFLVGLARQDADAEIRATRRGQPARSLDLDDLGLDESYNTWYAEYRFNFGERWGLVVAADTFNSDGSLTANTEFNFAGETIPIGAQLDTNFDVDTIFVDLMYELYQGDNTQVALGFGVHAFRFDAQIDARVSVGEAEAETRRAGDDLLAPLPNVRGQWIQTLGDRWTFFMTAGWLSADVDDWSGDFIYAHPRLHYRFGENMGVALGYQFTDVDVTHTASRIESQFQVELRGPTLTLSYAL